MKQNPGEIDHPKDCGTKDVPPKSPAARLKGNKERIIRIFEMRSRRALSAAKGLDSSSLQDSLPDFLDKLIKALENPEASRQQNSEEAVEIGKSHGEQRSEILSFDLNQVIKEYGILRQTLFEVLEEEGVMSPPERDVILVGVEAGLQSAAREFQRSRERHEAANRVRLADSENRLRVAAAVTRFGIWELDLTTQKAWRNEAHDHAFGYSEMLPEWDFEIFLKHVHSEDRGRVRERMTKAMSTGGHWKEEFRIVWPDQTVHWMLAEGAALKDDGGRVLPKMVGINWDITERKEAEHALAQSQQRLQLALKAGGLGTWEVDLKTRKLSRSREAQAILGLNENDLSVDQDVDRFVHPDDRENVIRTWVGAAADGRPFQHEYRIIRENGEIRWIDVRAETIHDENGEPSHFLGVVSDITKRKSTEALLAFERHQLGTIFSQSPAAMMILRGPDFVFEKVNPQYQSLFGDRELVGKSLIDALPELRNQPFLELIKRVFETGEPHFELEAPAQIMRNKGGKSEVRYFDFSVLQLRDANAQPYGVFNHNIDVTEKVLARKRVEESEARLRTQAEELEIAKATAENANATKSAFLANMSHEIRTPLGSILGFADLMKEKSLSAQEREQFLDTILRNGKALTRIIDDILDLAKVESGKLEVEQIEFSFLDLMDEVMDLFRERAKSKGLYLRLNNNEEVPSKICSDPARLRQILINIIGNALKFTNEGGVTIHVRSSAQEAGKATFEIKIRDTGIGISPEQKARLFHPFMQADNTTSRRFGGTGLGLVLSDRLAKALGGGISIEARGQSENGGSTFVISFVAGLPAESQQTTDLHSERSQTVGVDVLPLSGVRILVADDSPDNQFLVRRVLVKQGAVVDTASSGVEAFRKAVNGSYSLVLMDIQMPEMDGYEATRSLREAGFRKPIIALTAHAMAEEKARTRAAGCNGHLTKPLNQGELLEVIKKQLELAKA